jgi:hypothetical protein
MPITPRVVRDPTTGANNWGTGVGQSGAKWYDGYANPTRNPFDPSVINADGWLAGVTAPNAKVAYKTNMASVNQDQVLITAKGAGMTKYTSSGTTKKANYAGFAMTFYPKLGSIVQQVNQTNPRGPRGSAQNIARLTTYLQAVAATRGQN